MLGTRMGEVKKVNVNRRLDNSRWPAHVPVGNSRMGVFTTLLARFTLVFPHRCPHQHRP